METTTVLTDLFNNFALPTVMIIIFIVGIVSLFRYYAKRDEKHDEEMEKITEKYYERYGKVTDSNVRVADALNNNTKVIEKLLDKMTGKD